METYTLTQRELQRIAVISDCVQGRGKVDRAAQLLALSPRHIKRLKARYRQGGEEAMAHASRGGAHPPRAARAPRTPHPHLAARPPRLPVHRQRRLRRAREGEMLQLDGSPHDWLQGRGPRMTLLGYQDDATGKVVAAEFFSSEESLGYFLLLRRILRRYGIPLSLYGDQSSIFVRNDEHWTREEELRGRREPTQFGRALEQLGITFIAAQSPQAKGRIEHLWGCFQDRLVSELRLAGICTRESANLLLPRFLADYNRRFARAPRETEKAWRPAPKDLDRICCFVHERIVSNDNVVQWEGRRFQIPPQPHRFSFAGAHVHLYQSLAGHVAIYYGEIRLNFTQGGQG